jgi:hypothetical protein
VVNDNDLLFIITASGLRKYSAVTETAFGAVVLSSLGFS